MFTDKGRCPFDLLKHAMERNLFPQAQLPFENEKKYWRKTGILLPVISWVNIMKGDKMSGIRKNVSSGASVLKVVENQSLPGNGSGNQSLPKQIIS